MDPVSVVRVVRCTYSKHEVFCGTQFLSACKHVLELLYFPTLKGSRSRWRRVLQRFTVWCGVLQYVAICSSVLQCVECLLQCIVALVAVCYCTRKRGGQQRKLKPLVQSTHCNTLQHTAPHCNTLQRTATHCNALQHTATHCITL